jgi:hypothetical protein
MDNQQEKINCVFEYLDDEAGYVNTAYFFTHNVHIFSPTVATSQLPSELLCRHLRQRLFFLFFRRVRKGESFAFARFLSTNLSVTPARGTCRLASLTAMPAKI